MEETKGKQDVFQAIADPTRREILLLLAEEEMPIAAITKRFSISRTAVNKHLHVLTVAGLVRSQKSGRETRYSLKSDPLLEIQQWLSFFEQYWDQHLAALKKYVEHED